MADIEAQWDMPLTDSVLQRQPVFALNTKFGDLDILNEVLGIGTYEQAQPHARPVTIREQQMTILDLPALIATKEAAADPNPRKQSALEYLKALRQRSNPK